MTRAALLVWAWAGCGGTPAPPPPLPEPAPEPAPEPVASPPPEAPPHDLAGAPPYGDPPACAPSDADGVLRGEALTDALDAIAAGEPSTTIHHALLAGSCEVTAATLAAALAAGAAAADDAGRPHLATTLYVQALHADPSSVLARFGLARVLATSHRPLAAVTQLRELRWAGRAGLRSLEDAAIDVRLASLRPRPDWFELMHPNSDLEASVEPLRASGPAHALPAGLSWASVRGPVQPIRTHPAELAALAREAIGRDVEPAHGPRSLSRDGLPDALFAGGTLTVHGHAFWWRPTEDDLFLVIQHALPPAGEGQAPRQGWSVFDIDGGARLLRTFTEGDAPCDAEPRRGQRVGWYAPRDWEELHELRPCGDRAALTRLRVEGGRLVSIHGHVQLDPGATAAAADEPRQSRSPLPEIARVGEVPGLGPPTTCLPSADPHALAGDALAAALEDVRAGRTVGPALAHRLTASCTVDAGDVAGALAEGARARLELGDTEGARDLARSAVEVDPRHALARVAHVRALVERGDLDAAQRQLEELSAAGASASEAVLETLDDPGLSPLRARTAYWDWLGAAHEARSRLSIVPRVHAAGAPTTPAPWLPGPRGEGPLERARGPFARFSDLLSSAMTDRRYRPIARRGPSADLPDAVTSRGLVRRAAPDWWIHGSRALLVVPYLHPERGFDAVAFFERTDDGLRYLGRDRVYARCPEGHVEAMGWTTDGSELRLLTGCAAHATLCRVRFEADALRETCHSVDL